MKVSYLLVALGLVLVSGCVSEQEQREIDQDKCSTFGFRPGTDANATCMMRQNSQREEASERYMDRLHADEQRKRDRKQDRRQRERDEIDTRPQFDADGNPNFDTQGNYQGCHGLGCSVDNPDE
jgi:hypothetical protein